MSMMPPEMSSMGRALLGQLSQTSQAVSEVSQDEEGGAAEAKEGDNVDVSKVMDTVQNLT
jgi:hypothetical protein